jgi:tRNA 2-thiouridine synthesizing protein C
MTGESKTHSNGATEKASGATADPSGPKRFMYVNRKAPHGTIYAQESLELALITAAFDQHVSLLFLDDGVFQLKKNQDTAALTMKNFAKTFRALEDYEIDRIYVEAESMLSRGLATQDLIIPVEVLATAQLREIMARQDVIISS